MDQIKINLLDNQRKEILKRQQSAAKFNKILVAVAVVSLTLTGGMGWYRWKLNNDVENLTTELAQKERQVRDYKDIMDENAKLITKLASIGHIIETRELLDSKLELFYKIFTNSSIELREVGFGDEQSKNQLEIGGTVENVFGLTDFFAQIETYVSEDNLSSVTLDSLNRSEDKQYRFNYLLNLSSGNL